jgi:pilus assembly protein Flp/PilA
MTHLINATKRFLKDERGVTSIEYGLIAAATSVTIIAALALIGPALTDLWNQIAAAL